MTELLLPLSANLVLTKNDQKPGFRAYRNNLAIALTSTITPWPSWIHHGFVKPRCDAQAAFSFL